MKIVILVRSLMLVILSSVIIVSAHGDIAEYDDYTYIKEATGTMVRIYVEGDTRYFESNVLPNHETGDFPNSGNPHTLSPQNLMLQTPAKPQLADMPTEVGLGKFGLAINGVPFEREAAEWYNRDSNSGWQYDAFGGGIELGFDMNNAHVQPSGLYHYHGIPDVLIETQNPTEHPHLVGFAADGFPIYLLYGYKDPADSGSEVVELFPSYQLKQGTRPSGPGGTYDGTFNEDWEYIAGSGDLDECNGRFGITPEFPEGTYHYVLTNDFPRIPACWSGTPGDAWLPRERQGGQQPGGDSSQSGQQPNNNNQDGQQPGNNDGQGNQQPDNNGGQPDLAAAAQRLGITEQALRNALGPQQPPDIDAAAQRLGISPQALRDALGMNRP